MNLPQISFPVREFVRMRLTGELESSPPSSFNELIQQTAPIYGVQPFQLVWGKNLFTGRYGDVQSLIQSCNISSSGFPFAVLSVAKDDMIGRAGMGITPSNYSGPIFVSLDFFISYEERTPKDGEAMWFAIEDALTTCFNTQDAYSLMPPGVTYNDEMSMDQGPFTLNETRWLQMISATFVFRRVA